MDKRKVSAIIYFVVATIGYIGAILNFISSNLAMGVTYICMGSMMLYVFVKTVKGGDDNDKNDKNK